MITESKQFQRAVLVVPAIYLALLPASWATAVRSIAFAVSAGLLLLDVAIGTRAPTESMLSPGRAIMFPLCAWLGWATASIAWSVRPDYTLGELRTEVAWVAMTMGIFFYVSAHKSRAWDTLVGALIGSFAVLAALAVLLAASPFRWDPAKWHAGVGAFSTYIVLVAPFLFTFLLPAPGGFGARPFSRAAAAALLGLLLVAARVSDNRMVWIALAGVFATGFVLASARWHATRRGASLRWLMPLLALLLVLGIFFADVAQERADDTSSVHVSMMQSFAADRRLALWKFAAQRISERPWVGYGFGKSILQGEFRRALQDPGLTHPHNLFASQWLQLGGVGLAGFVVLLVALTWRFVAFLRAPDDTLAMIGLIGLATLVGFILKNLTDDFLVRSNAKEFWALTAMLLGYGVRMESTRQLSPRDALL